MKIVKDIQATIDKTDITYLRELVGLGLQRLEEVDKKSWGDKYKDHKDFGEDFLIRTTL